MSSAGENFSHQPWKILASHYVIETPHLRLRADSVELPDGTVVDEYFVQESRGYSVILPITTDGKVVLVRQYKHGIGKVILELPAGGIDPGEDAATCAARELAEETGYIGEAPEFIGAFNTNPTGSSGRFHLFIIRNAELKVAQDLDSTEDIEVVTVDFNTLQRYIRDGTIDTNTHLTSVLYIFDLVAQGKVTLAPGALS